MHELQFSSPEPEKNTLRVLIRIVLIYFAGYKPENYVLVHLDLQYEYVNVQMSQEIAHKIKLHHKVCSDCRLAFM